MTPTHIEGESLRKELKMNNDGSKFAIGCAAAVLVTVGTPLSLIIWYLLLQHIHASETLWVLYWVNLPIALLGAVIGTLFREINKGK